MRKTGCMTYSEAEKGEIRSDLTALYRAGRVDFPDRAEAVGTVASRLGELIGTLNERAAQLGDPTVTQHVLATCADIDNALIRTVTTLNDCAVGLVHVADDFVARDSYAREVFTTLSKGITHGPVAQAPVPEPVDKDRVLQEGVGDEYVSAPDAESPDRDKGDRDGQLAQDQEDVGESGLDDDVVTS